HLHAQRAAGFRCAHNLQRLFPGRILRSIHRNHFLSGFQSIHRFAAHRRKLVHHHWLALKRRVRHPCNRVVPTQQYNRKNQIHRRPRERNHRTLPTLLAHQFVRQTFRRLFPGINITDVLPRHAHVSAQGQCAHTPVRRPALDPKKPRSKPNRENIHAHSEKPRGDKVSPFVDQDNHAQDQHHADNRVHSVAVPRPFILRYAQSPAQFRPWPRSNLQSRRVPQVRFFTWVLGFLSWDAGAPGSLFYLGLGFLILGCGCPRFAFLPGSWVSLSLLYSATSFPLFSANSVLSVNSVYSFSPPLPQLPRLFPRHSPCLFIRREHVLHTLNLHLRRPAQHPLNHFRYPQKPQPLLQNRRHRHLIRRIQRAGPRPALL